MRRGEWQEESQHYPKSKQIGLNGQECHIPFYPIRYTFSTSFKPLTYKLTLYFLWSWRESNPRPNKEPIRFLHAYPSFGFRTSARPEPPTGVLASLDFGKLSKPNLPILDISAPPVRHASGKKGSREMSRFSTLCRNKAYLLYFDQAARA